MTNKTSLVTCAVCGNQSTDCRIMLRDAFGDVKAGFAAPLAGEDRDTAYGLMDRHPFGSLDAECKSCRDRIREEQSAELDAMIDQYLLD